LRVSDKSVQRHDRLIERLDEWSHSIRSAYSEQMQCGRGCAKCCHGLFDISVYDALRVAKGFDSLAAQTRDCVAGRSASIQDLLMRVQPDMKAPYFLDRLTPDRIDEIVDIAGEVPCPFLDEDNSCLIYASRPVACRLEGIPMIDIHDGLFSDWCELNFREGVTPEMKLDLRLDYCEIQAVEQDIAIFVPSVVYALAKGQSALIFGR